jgi:uncharacterized protein (DUF1800 family)
MMFQPLSDSWTPLEAAHLLRRAGFGGSPDDIAKFHALGRIQAVDSLLHPQESLDAFPLPEWAVPEKALADMRQRQEEVRAARGMHPELSPDEAEKLKRATNQKYQKEYRMETAEAQAWWFHRMLATQAPLREKMVLFWHDHFASSIQKVKQPYPMLKQNELFRQNAFGSFKELTHAIVRDPAMMLYLDTQSSKKGKPNENFPRELMELFTLGEGHYTEADIKEAARALTGYQINRQEGTVVHNKRQWDNGDKTIYGKTGKFDGDDVVNLIFELPAAASMLPAKLWSYFVSEDPAAEIVDALAASFKASDFKIEPLLRQIFLSKEFNAESVVRNQIKCPVQYLIQLFKELEVPSPPPVYLLTSEQQLGQILFAPPNVAGWDWGKGWINTNTLLSRYNIAGFVTKGSTDAPGEAGSDGDAMMVADASAKKFVVNAMRRAQRNWQGPDYEKISPRPLREDPAALVDSLIQRFFQAPVGDRQREAFVAYAVEKKGAIFTNHEVAELCHLMLSTPSYQLA